MSFDHRTPFPGSRAYVIKLRQESAPSEGRWLGRLEHVASGRQYDFSCADELLRQLAADVAQMQHEDGGAGSGVIHRTGQ